MKPKDDGEVFMLMVVTHILEMYVQEKQGLRLSYPMTCFVADRLLPILKKEVRGRGRPPIEEEVGKQVQQLIEAGFPQRKARKIISTISGVKLPTVATKHRGFLKTL